MVIVAGFVIDILLQGTLEEAASLVVILRLWRVVKIVEEMSVGAEGRTSEMQEQIDNLEQENKELREKVRELRSR